MAEKEIKTLSEKIEKNWYRTIYTNRDKIKDVKEFIRLLKEEYKTEWGFIKFINKLAGGLRCHKE